jgi:DNA polymerase-3 subunit epsilon
MNIIHLQFRSGIYPGDTKNAKSFLQVYPEIERRLKNRVVVAHNESFDRNVLMKSMALHGLQYEDLNIANRWECTVKIYKAKGLKPTKLSDCCREMKIHLNHHEALSDARACAKLYLMR